MSAQRLVLVDGSSYLYRAYHALPPLTTSGGVPTGAIHGVVAMLRRLLQDEHPDYLAVVFDPRGRTFRDDLYADYKANRPPMPDELERQVAPLFDIIRALGLPLIVVDGVEADDVIGTLATQATAAGLHTVIATGDKDMAQLVGPAVQLLDTMNGTRLDASGVEQKFGVPPGLIVDYLTLVGDAVDNVPGVPKCGPKTASKWLREHGSLEGVMAAAATMKGKIGESLRGSLAHLPLSRRLVTIDTAVPMATTLIDLRPVAADRERLIALYRGLEFRTWLDELLAPASPPIAQAADPLQAPAVPPEVVPRHYELVLTAQQFDAWMQRLQGAELIAFDTETNALDYISAEVVGVSFAVTPHEAAYVPCAHIYPDAPTQLAREWVLERLRPLLEDDARAKTGHNLKFDCSVLANHGIALRGIRHDSMLESYVLDSSARQHDMDSLALKYLGERTIRFEEVAGKGAAALTFDQVQLEAAGEYAAEDADVALRLHQTLWPRVAREEGLARLYRDIEIPLVPVLSRMERNGVLVDATMLATQSELLAEGMQALEQSAYAAAGETFNLASPRQIQEILFERLQLPVKERTPTGQPSTAESALAELALEYDLPRLILEYRALAKLKSTYTDKLPLQVNARTGRIHTNYHQAVAATGRLSSSDPNLQNIPIRTPEGRRIRQAFVAPPGKKLVAADYSQIELRIMAHLSSDERLMQAFAAGEDVHRATAAEVFGASPAEVTPEQRRAAKAINFGLIYGMSAFGLARQLGIERAAAQDYVDRYFSRYPGVRRYMDETRTRARERGYVETLFGRRLALPEINAQNRDRRQAAERLAINAPVQGTAADIIKRAMISVDACLAGSALPARLVMQVHDELVLEVDARHLDVVRARVVELMRSAASLDVPLVVEAGEGDNWDEAH